MGNFYTDTIMKDLNFSSPKRIDALSLLEDSMRERIKAVIADATALGQSLMVFETYRSEDRQMSLFEKGVTQLRQVGVHHYGLACDLVKVVDGDPSWKGDFQFLGGLARKHGLIWGGDWGAPELSHTFRDPVHLQRCSIKMQGPLFRGEWYPDAGYDPYHG